MAGSDATHSTQDSPPERRNNSSSLRRALAILLFLAEDHGHPLGATLTDIAVGVELSKSTILRLVAPLREVRLIDQDPDSGRYRLGPQNALLGQLYLERIDIRHTAAPLLHKLTQDARETVHLVTFDPPEIVYIDKVEGPQAVRMHSRIGNRQPAYCTATGKLFLAHAATPVLEDVLEAGMPARTPNTITTPERLRTELARVRALGYAIDDIENEPDIRCVAAPIFDHTGAVTTAISVSGPANRITPERDPEVGDLVIQTARAITQQLGGAAPTADQL